jgi:hypothetical protein
MQLDGVPVTVQHLGQPCGDGVFEALGAGAVCKRDAENGQSQGVMLHVSDERIPFLGCAWAGRLADGEGLGQSCRRHSITNRSLRTQTHPSKKPPDEPDNRARTIGHAENRQDQPCWRNDHAEARWWIQAQSRVPAVLGAEALLVLMLGTPSE